MHNKRKKLKHQAIMLFSLTLLMFSVYIQTREIFEKEEYNINFENVDTKNMSPVDIELKKDDMHIIEKIFNDLKNNNILKEYKLINKLTEAKETNKANEVTNQFVWKLPTELGTITQYPSYNHPALDIISPRSYGEPIYSVGKGVISSIYTDLSGGLCVTVLHNVNGVNLTSHYVHFSRYADIYVGKEVTENDILGYMGSTGNSTGPHLHVAVVDCGYNVPGDPNCYDLNSFLRYTRQRFSEGHYGLGVYYNVPHSWSSR